VILEDAAAWGEKITKIYTRKMFVKNVPRPIAPIQVLALLISLKCANSLIWV